MWAVHPVHELITHPALQWPGQPGTAWTPTSSRPSSSSCWAGQPLQDLKRSDPPDDSKGQPMNSKHVGMFVSGNYVMFVNSRYETHPRQALRTASLLTRNLLDVKLVPGKYNGRKRSRAGKVPLIRFDPPHTLGSASPVDSQSGSQDAASTSSSPSASRPQPFMTMMLHRPMLTQILLKHDQNTKRQAFRVHSSRVMSFRDRKPEVMRVGMELTQLRMSQRLRKLPNDCSYEACRACWLPDCPSDEAPRVVSCDGPKCSYTLCDQHNPQVFKRITAQKEWFCDSCKLRGRGVACNGASRKGKSRVRFNCKMTHGTCKTSD